MNLRFSGAYQVRVLRPDGSIRMETEFFDNLITNQGLDVYGGVGSVSVLWVTNGTTPPSVTDTTLSGTILGYSGSGSAANTGQTATLPNYAELTFTHTFAVGGVIGTITELGRGAGGPSTVNTLFSRALIVNSGGTPISITLTATDQLVIVYKIRAYIPDDDVIASMDVNGVTTNLTIRPMLVSNAAIWGASIATLSFDGSQSGVHTGAIGSRTGVPAGTFTSCSSVTNATYVPGSYARAFSMIWLPAKGAFTAASFRAGQASGQPAGGWQVSLSPSIIKTNLQTLRIEGELSWSRYVP